MKKKYQSGSTLIEVIVCMFLVTVLLILYTSAMNTLIIVRKLRYENLAYHIANKQMETLRNTPYASLGSGTITDTQLSQIPSGAGNFTVANYPSTSGVKEMVVTVSWNDGIAKSVVLKSLSGTGGINPP